MKRTLFFVLINLFSLLAHSKVEIFRVPTIPASNAWVLMHIPYSFGTHEGEAKLYTGNVSMDTEDITKTQGEFSVPIQSLTTKKEERDCHMMESLGLDYRESDFPEVHVCSDTNTLPSTGKNAIKYPTITLKIFSLRPEEGQKILSDKVIKVEADGEWTVHGKSYRWVFPLTLAKEGEGIRVKGEIPFSLKNHDIVVKPAKVLFMEISVSDNVKAEINLLLEKVAQ